MWPGPMFHVCNLEPPPGAVTAIRAWMNPGMDAPCLDIDRPAPDLRLHMEHHKAFQLRVKGEYDDLEFLVPCADLITVVHLGSTTVRDARAIASLKRLRTLYRPPPYADPMLPALPRLRHLTLTDRHAFDVLVDCAELRELSVGVASLELLLSDQESSITSLGGLPGLPQLQMLSVGGPSFGSLAGIERFTGLRTLQLVGVLLRENSGRELLAERFGFTAIDSLVARNKADERRLGQLRTRLDADRMGFERIPAVASVLPPEVSQSHPACIILLIDTSRSTEQPVGLDLRVIADASAEHHHVSKRFGKGPDGDKRHCDAYTDAINRYLDRCCARVPETVRAHVHIGLIAFGATVGWAWTGALKGRTFVSIADLQANPLQSAGTRRWLEPLAAGETPLGEAMELARLALSEWLQKHPEAVPPVVITISSGKYTGDDLGRHAWGIRGLRTPSGPALFFHIVREAMYGVPHFGIEGYQFSEASDLFSHASPLPPSIEEAARAARYHLHGAPRGYLDGAAEADVENLLHVFTALPGLAWSDDIIRHPLPPHQVTEEEIKEWPWDPPGAPREAKAWRPPKVKGPMTEQLFWKIMDQSRKGVEEGEEQLDRLTLLLDQLDETDLVAWQRILVTKLDEAYRWDLWAVAFIAKSGCSDDGFEYFRAWLIAQGRKYFEASLATPEHAAKRIAPGDEAELEGLLSIADAAYESKTKRQDLWERASVERPQTPVGAEWNEDDLPRLFPKLVRKYS